VRTYCNICKYPVKTCVCSHISTVHFPITLTILQHKREVTHAKNTARLVSLCALDKTNIIVTSDNDALAQLQTTLCVKQCAVIYPNDASRAIETLPVNERHTINHIVVIDGSWKQAYSIIEQHSWLKACAFYHFDAAPLTRYRIRHTSMDNGVSTLEAVAYAMNTLFDVDVSALYEAQEAMQSFWQSPTPHLRKV
jgi:DTW domain-containing protein YfiP